MNRTTFALVLALVPFAPAAVAAPTAPVAAPKTITAPPSVSGIKQVLTCTTVFEKLLSDLKSGMVIDNVNSTLINGETALAESPKLPLQGGGFPEVLSSAKASGQTVAIKSHLAAPAGNSSADMSASLEKNGESVRMRWTYGGKSHMSTVDTCTSGYWTAADGSSAIAVKLSAPYKPAVPE